MATIRTTAYAGWCGFALRCLFTSCFAVCVFISSSTQRRGHSLMAFTKSLKEPYVKRGSGSSLKNIFRAPVVTWMSSHLLSLRSTFSSEANKVKQQTRYWSNRILKNYKTTFCCVKEFNCSFNDRQTKRHLIIYHDWQQSEASGSPPGFRLLCTSRPRWALQAREAHRGSEHICDKTRTQWDPLRTDGFWWEQLLQRTTDPLFPQLLRFR